MIGSKTCYGFMPAPDGSRCKAKIPAADYYCQRCMEGYVAREYAQAARTAEINARISAMRH
ncbi:MAG: hypothetical protein ACOYOU_18810, partial [Kiritimatiellia bacterium]